MATFMVLHIPRSPPGTQMRPELGDRIASLLGDAYLQLDCIWLVHSVDMADQIRDRLSVGLPPEDGFVVLGIGDEAAWRGLTEEQGEWLVRHV